MKKWRVSDIRWANRLDLELPFWMDWNKQNPLPSGFWQRIWEYPYLLSRIPSSAKCLDIGGTYPFVLFPNYPNAISIDCRDLNTLNHPLHLGKWPKEKLVVCDAADTPFADDAFDYVFSISALEEMPDILGVMKEMIRLSSFRIVVTLDVSDQLGLSHIKLRELEDFLNISIPRLPVNCLHSLSPELENKVR